ncbi:MAG TPA: carotenoid oxygenase family protein [Microthrixaceae bacterium]|nr:carotenoid oxygenase family protein [Microthrixaceae bacterium]
MDRRRFLTALGAGAGIAAVGLPMSGCAAPPAPDPLAGGPFGAPTPTPGRDRWARVPSAFNRRVTAEQATTPLTLLDGELPSDMAGHVFFQSLSLRDTDAGFSGDSMVWRVDLDGEVPTITSRLLRTTDLLLHDAVADTDLRFESRGVSRLGPLGMQDQVNTALVPLNGNRLVATVDGGRSWELDPATLAPVGPVGRLDDHRPLVDLPVNRFLCPLNITSAHPPYDAETGEYYGVSLSIVPIPGLVYCEILCWDGVGAIKRVPLTTPDGAPVLLSQSAHQMCISRDHLLIADTSTVIEFGKLMYPPHSAEAAEAQTPRPDTVLFIVSRDELRRTAGGATAVRAVIPRESGHLMVDHDAAPGRIVVHSAHTSAMDFAEWVMPTDRHPVTGEPVRSDLVDAITPVSYDIGVVGRYEIDTRTGAVLDQHAFFDDHTWGSGGLTARNPLTPIDTVGDVFHANSGMPTDIAVQRMHAVFTSYPHRIVPDAELPWSGVPTSLLRIDHDAGRVVDAYWHAGDRFGWTPTFVPRRGTATGSTDGYVVSVVYSDHADARSSGTELWVFDAADLARGPIARLGRADLAMPLTLHSTWLDSLRASRPDTRVDVAAELTERADTWLADPRVASIVRNDVLPAYDAVRV